MRSAFIAVYSKHPIYEDYLEIAEPLRAQEIPLVLMLMRWDGYIGFPGSIIDEGETSLDAAVREFKEETGVSLTDDEIASLEFQEKVSLSENSALYLLNVPYSRLLDIRKVSASFGPGVAEIAGTMLLQVKDYSTENQVKGLPALRQQLFAHGAKAHFECVVSHLQH